VIRDFPTGSSPALRARVGAHAKPGKRDLQRLRPASIVMLVRDGSEGLELFMLKQVGMMNQSPARVRSILAAHQAGEVVLTPPALVCVEDAGRFASADELFDHAPVIRAIEPTLVAADDGSIVLRVDTDGRREEPGQRREEPGQRREEPGQRREEPDGADGAVGTVGKS